MEILLPNFIEGVSDVSLYVKGIASNSDRTLFETDSFSNGWVENRISAKAKFLEGGVSALLSFDIDEEKLLRDDDNFELGLEYYSPAGYPVTLMYPAIEIDDSKRTMLIFSSDTTLKDFQIENNK